MEYTYVTPRQFSILSILAGRRSISVDEVANALGLRREDLMRDVAELERKGLIEVTKTIHYYYELTSIAQNYLKLGFPEEVVYRHLKECLPLNIAELISCIESKTSLPRKELEVGLQYLVKGKCLKIAKEGVVVDDSACKSILEEASKLKAALSALSEGSITLPEDVARVLKHRKLVEVRERVEIYLNATPKLQEHWQKGLIREKTLLTIVKPEVAPHLEQYIIKEFDLAVEPYMPHISKKHPFMQFIDELRDILVSMGFEEVKGPHVEAELWNFDALFQAQDHPAREIHDTFFLKTTLKAKANPELMNRAKSIHEAGWNYAWNPERTLRLVLRSQTTAVTARAIYSRGGGEYRVFTIDRNFRPENLDAKHSMEFYQLDGVIVGRNVNFKHLLYFFKELAAALGIKEVWFKPAYFPFTEPSVEGYIRHPKLGWIEVFPGGMFRPEVMAILGAEGYNAAAWGIGVDRLAMVVLGLDDIRLLFTRDLETLSKIKYTGLPYFIKGTTGREVKVVRTLLG